MYTYIQSRFYRAPEVILGARYGMPIDMWSLGCILAELLTGYPLLPGEDEGDQLSCIIELLGMPPQKLLDQSKRAKNFISSKGLFTTFNTQWFSKQRLAKIEVYYLKFSLLLNKLKLNNNQDWYYLLIILEKFLYVCKYLKWGYLSLLNPWFTIYFSMTHYSSCGFWKSIWWLFSIVLEAFGVFS